MAGRDNGFSFAALEDPDTMVEIVQRVMTADGSHTLSGVHDDTRWRLEEALSGQGRARWPRDVHFRSAR